MTNQTIPFNAADWPASEGGKRLTGKYLQLIEAFASTLVLDPDDFLVKANPEYLALIDGMAKVFWEHITPEHAETIIFRQCVYFEVEAIGRKGALSTPENKDLLDLLVKRIKSFFESIPRRCTLLVELPSLVVQPGLAPLAPDVRLIGSAASAGTNKLLSMLKPSAHLEIDVDGYGDSSLESPAASAALSIAKQYAFVMQAFGISATSYSVTMGGSTFRDSARSEFSPITIPEGVRRSFSRIKINDSKLVFYGWLEKSKAPRGLLGFDPGRPPAGAMEEKLAQDYLLTDVRRFFAARSEEDFEQIAAAIEWYHDSIWADNDTFAYIAACIGLEAVLGSADEQLDSLSKRLSDRYAFLMGRGRKDREALRASYADVLKLRGRLVHGKAARLNAKERPLLKKVQDLLLQLLWKEIHRIMPLASTL